MAGSNSNAHGGNIMEEEFPKTRAAIGDVIEESIAAALQRMFGGRLPLAGNGDLHQHSPAASLVANNHRSRGHEDRHNGHGRAAGGHVDGTAIGGVERRRGNLVAPHDCGMHGGETCGQGHGLRGFAADHRQRAAHGGDDMYHEEHPNHNDEYVEMVDDESYSTPRFGAIFGHHGSPYDGRLGDDHHNKARVKLRNPSFTREEDPNAYFEWED
ncbi:hypothetical protein CFC21_006106 [Triticum aestivum]|uniref:Uncharacterized protein n=2 Tax=Triticum aestivum TaxID=4565 RepID=A0A9R1DB52_WHEAT|nr:hypothetical protein CFC21_006106 [Triticum aestivum]